MFDFHGFVNLSSTDATKFLSIGLKKIAIAPEL